MNIKDAKVLITGATSGIGYETAKVLLEQGAQVVISGRNPEKLEKAKQELNAPGFLADVQKEDEIITLINNTIQELNGFNVIINNAGLGRFSPLINTTVEDFQQQWQVNVRGLFIAGREAAKHFIENKYGNIINVGSTAALNGFSNGSSYVASKFAVSGLTQCWRAELRPHNIRVMQVNPSEVVTEFAEKAGYNQEDNGHKLKSSEIAHLIITMLSMRDIGFIPEASVWATNPWGK